MQAVIQCLTCGLSYLCRQSPSMHAPSLWQMKGNSWIWLKFQILDAPGLVTVLLIWQNLVSCEIWFDVLSLCPASLKSCETMWYLAGPNSHLNCIALSLRQLLYTARILSLLFPAVEVQCAYALCLGFYWSGGNMPLGQWLNAGITGSSSLGVLFMRITRLLQT